MTTAAIEQLAEFLRAESDAVKKTLVIVYGGAESTDAVKSLAGVTYLDPETPAEEARDATAAFVDAPAGQASQILVHADCSDVLAAVRDAAQTVVPFGLAVPEPPEASEALPGAPLETVTPPTEPTV